MEAQDVWDWADRLSDRVHRAEELQRLRAQVRNAQTTCGSCVFWMTDSCPRETHDNRTGRKHGPSMGAIKCDRFRMSGSDAADVERAQKRIAELAQDGGAKP